MVSLDFNELHNKTAKQLLERYFLEGLKSDEVEINTKLKSLVLENNIQLN